MKRPKPIVQKFGGLTCISRTGEPTTEQEVREGLENASTEHLPPRAMSPVEYAKWRKQQNT